MMRGLLTVAMATVGLASTALAATVPELSERQAAVKIMPLGDSITGSPGCWRALLWQQLQDAGITNTDFVGTLPSQGCGFDHDGENEGHGSMLATELVSDGQLPEWLSSATPDIVMMHLGTNDVWNSIDSQEIIDAFSTFVQQMRESKETMNILVAKIIPLNPEGCAECGDGVVDFNAAIEAWAPTISTETSPVTVVDCFTGFDTATDTDDGVHPNDAGNVKLANSWFEPLSEAIAQVGG